MAAPKTYSPVLTIIGNDLDADATFNADVKAGEGLVGAGRLMAYDPATESLSVVTDFAAGVIYGVLADEVDASNATVPAPGMVYRGGLFLRQEIEVINQTPIPAGSALETKLRDLGINLIDSWDGYAPLTPVPAGAKSNAVPYGTAPATAYTDPQQKKEPAATTGQTTEPPGAHPAQQKHHKP